MKVWIVSKSGVEWNELHTVHQSSRTAQAEADKMNAKLKASKNVLDSLSHYTVTKMAVFP